MTPGEYLLTQIVPHQAAPQQASAPTPRKGTRRENTIDKYRKAMAGKGWMRVEAIAEAVQKTAAGTRCYLRQELFKEEGLVDCQLARPALGINYGYVWRWVGEGEAE